MNPAGYPPPQQGYAPPQQGYPPPQQGYQPQQPMATGMAPPPQQGYPPPQPGYQQPQQPMATGMAPPPQQGYPPQQQGYQQPQQPMATGMAPPPQQGYPPPQQGYQQPQQPMATGMAPPPQQAQPLGVPTQPGGNSGIPGGVDQGSPRPAQAPVAAPVNKGGPPPKFSGEIPDDDVSRNSDDDDDEAPQTAYSMDTMDTVAGYSFGADFLPPPPPTYDEAMKPEVPENQNSLPRLTDDEAREALLLHVAERCCWGKRAAEQLTFKNVEHSVAFHYILESFTERRNTKWVHDPYVGQPIDGPQNGPAPLPWSIQVAIPELFKNNTKLLEVPHTASVKPCHNCRASGYVRCPRCRGRGQVRCGRCHGRGSRRVRRYNSSSKSHYYTTERCFSCGGDGRKTCFRCDGYGQIICKVCDGNCQLKFYIRLTVEWLNHVEDSVVERTNLPDELIRDVTGETVFQEEHPKVWPISHFPDQDINNASLKIVKHHEQAYRRELLHKQRHIVRVIPVAEPKCQYKDENFVFFVYGFEKKVHAPEYPMQCCWGCSIL